MTTKSGITALLGGGYLVAFGIAGINANSGGALAASVVALIVGFVVGGWAVVLPWDDGARRVEHESPGPVHVPRG